MGRIFKYVLVLSCCSAVAFTEYADSAQNIPGRWSLQGSVGLRQATLNKKHQPWAISPAFDTRFCYRVDKSLSVGTVFSYSKIYNDAVSTSTFKIGNGQADEYWESYNFGPLLVIHVDNNSEMYPNMQFSIGVSSWKVKRVEDDKPVIVFGADGEEKEYKATEMYFMGGIGGESFISPRLAVTYDVNLYIRPGIGTDFDKQTNDYRSHGYADFRLGLSYHFGRSEPTLWEKWRVQEEAETPGTATESPETGGPGLADDADHDGVPDEADLCPHTPPAAAGHVDEKGCPIDSDDDGIADYLDRCLGTASGMPVDSMGCPIDEDSDGVTDAIDQCPGTPIGYAVDAHGCVDKTELFKRKVLHVNYQPGGSDIDARTSIYLDTLARMMKDFPDLKVTVFGYTDNIGGETANLQMSQKRADKVRMYLSTKGIDEGRITAIGMGETDFIATNENKYGRELNRRIEIEFEY